MRVTRIKQRFVFIPSRCVAFRTQSTLADELPLKSNLLLSDDHQRHPPVTDTAMEGGCPLPKNDILDPPLHDWLHIYHRFVVLWVEESLCSSNLPSYFQRSNWKTSYFKFSFFYFFSVLSERVTIFYQSRKIRKRLKERLKKHLTNSLIQLYLQERVNKINCLVLAIRS